MPRPQHLIAIPQNDNDIFQGYSLGAGLKADLNIAHFRLLFDLF